jgi:hypothetical protein
MEELVDAEKRLLRLYADPKNRFSRQALDSQVEELVQSRDIIKKRICELSEAQLHERERRKRLENIDYILSNLRDSIRNATPETKRDVIENLLLEVRIGKDSRNGAALKLVYAFEEPKLRSSCYNPTNNEPQSCQLHSARMSLWFLRRPPAPV